MVFNYKQNTSKTACGKFAICDFLDQLMADLRRQDDLNQADKKILAGDDKICIEFSFSISSKKLFVLKICS
jgi:hypothetical protein